MNKCNGCGASYRKRVAPRTIRYPRHRTTVDAESYVCVGCGDEYVTTQQMEDTYRRAADQIRQEHGLLSANDITAIAHQYNVSLGLLARLIGLKSEVINRWRGGVAIQGRLADKFLRVIRRFPGVMQFLVEDLDEPAQRTSVPRWKVAVPASGSPNAPKAWDLAEREHTVGA